MDKTLNPIMAALSSGSRAKGHAGQIRKLTRSLSKVESVDDLTVEQRVAILKLATACRATKAVQRVLDATDIPAVDQLVEFRDLFCYTYYPVLEDGRRTVSFWSIKDSAVVSAEDVHEWVRDIQVDKKTGERKVVPVTFGAYWRKHRPDYDIYLVAADRSQWGSKLINIEGRKAVNTAHGNPPVKVSKPKSYDAKVANRILDDILARTITDDDADNAIAKQKAFVLDAGAHLLALRDFGKFRCRKIFCFTSTNGGQGSGKSLLHESLASLVPVGASCTVPTTTLAGTNLLPLYSSSVCVLTEAPSTSNERYTSEDVKAFADAGWKTAEEKYVAKRPVFDNSLKLLSSNHLAPLPVDSQHSRRVEFFVSAEIDDGGTSLRRMLDNVQNETGWSSEDLRECIGWAILERAQGMLDRGASPCAVARRSIDAQHILTPADYDYFVVECMNSEEMIAYSDYKDWRNKKGFTWYVDAYRFEGIKRMALSKDTWIEPLCVIEEPDDDPSDDPDSYLDDFCEENVIEEALEEPEKPRTSRQVAQEGGSWVNTSIHTRKPDPASTDLKNGFTGTFQYKSRVAKLRVEPEQLTPYNIVELVASDWLKKVTDDYRAGKADGNEVLPQVFPAVYYNKLARGANISGYTDFVHVDFDDISKKRDDITPDKVCEMLSEMDGFVVGATSPGGDGAWAIFYAGKGKIVDRTTFVAAIKAITSRCENALYMKADTGLISPTTGRRMGYDANVIYDPVIEDGGLPEPFEWKVPRYAVAGISTSTLVSGVHIAEMTVEQRARQERFVEVVVERSCANIVASGDGDRHNTAIRAIANIVLTCRERGVVPLSIWGRKVRDACISCGLPKGEVAGIMGYWRQEAGVGS